MQRDLPSESKPNAAEPLIQVATVMMHQVLQLLDQTVTSDEHLTYKSEYIPGSTIGKHLRHVHDHFRLLLEAIPARQTSAPLELNYDVRSRNIASETSHSAAKKSFEDLKRRLVEDTDNGRRVSPTRKINLEAVTPIVVDLESTWARELWFTCLHATHHFALIRVIASGEIGLKMLPDFGVAPSTLASREWNPKRAEKL